MGGTQVAYRSDGVAGVMQVLTLDHPRCASVGGMAGVDRISANYALTGVDAAQVLAVEDGCGVGLAPFDAPRRSRSGGRSGQFRYCRRNAARSVSASVDTLWPKPGYTVLVRLVWAPEVGECRQRGWHERVGVPPA